MKPLGILIIGVLCVNAACSGAPGDPPVTESLPAQSPIVENPDRNPYFGDRMLKCGLVQETIDANFKNPPASSTASRASSGHNH